MDIYDERERKADIIKKLYNDRTNRISDIATKLSIPKNIVQKVTQMHNFEHGKKKTSDNLNEGQKNRAVIMGDDLSFLDKYNF